MSLSRPTISVVIPCHNYGRFLAEAIDSVLMQSYPASRVIVVDDGSADNTGEVALRYRPQVDYVRLSHSGVSRARNEGLHQVTSDFVVFLDADDALAPDYLEKTLAAWQQAPEPKPAFIYTQRSDLGSGTNISRHPPFDRNRLKFNNYIMVSALLRTGPAREVGFDPSFVNGLEDYDFFLGLVEKGYAGLLLDLPLLRVRAHGVSRTHASGVPVIRWELMCHLMDKHRAIYAPGERRQFMRNLRQFMADRLIEQRAATQTTRTRLKTLRSMIQYRLPARVIASQLIFALRRPVSPIQENSHD